MKTTNHQTLRLKQQQIMRTNYFQRLYINIHLHCAHDSDCVRIVFFFILAVKAPFQLIRFPKKHTHLCTISYPLIDAVSI